MSVALLAVDGGATKTDLALVSADGALLALERGPLSSPHYLGLEGPWTCSQSCSSGLRPGPACRPTTGP